MGNQGAVPFTNMILGCAGDGISLGCFGHILYLENKSFDSDFLGKTRGFWM